ncbi:MAG: hypothetical protein M1821_003389 [Bathelium mastoideum]|nr:MAG: hypothetical protein M1821_003389 [Bathelium mastoideum]KAI9686055.1 MAG: hypothetical protein M1822_004038 [Bathelium mastoideum]
MSTSAITPEQNRGPAINAISWTCVAISTLFVAARLFTRLLITRNPGYDDAIVVFALILFIVPVALATSAVAHGLGHHIVFLQKEQIERIAYLGSILEPIGIFAYCLPKWAVARLIIKLMGPQKRGVWFLYSIIAILFASSAVATILNFVQCDPPKHIWKPEIPAKCWNPNVSIDFSMFAGSWSAFADLCLAVFPCTVFWNLQMPQSRKIGISVLMGLGVIAMACAIVKVTQLPLQKLPDFTWDFFGLLIWTFIETMVVIVCACIPTLPQLVYLILGKRKKTNYQLYDYPRKQVKHSHSGATSGSYDTIVDQKTKSLPVSTKAPRQNVDDECNITRTLDIHQRWDVV